MNLTADFPKNNWANYLKNTKPAFQFATQSKRRAAVKDFVDQVQRLIEKTRYASAIDRIILAIYLDKGYAIAVLKREGIFRHSSYLERRNPIGGFAEEILKNGELLQLSETEKAYFNTIKSITFIHELLKGLKQRIQSELSYFKKTECIRVKGNVYRKSRLKSLLSINERIFLYNMVGDRKGKDATNLSFYSKEEISEAISYLLASYNKLFGVEKMDVHFIDEKYASSNEAETLILFACLVKNIQDIEILVESFGYVVIKDNNNLSFHSPDIAFAQSLDMSNIMQELQTQTNNFWIFKANPEALSLFDLAKSYHQKFPDSFRLETDPFARYVLRIPMPLFEHFLNKTDLSFFKEELIIATGIQSELLLDIKELQNYEIAEGLTFYDFLKILRLFIIKGYLIYEKMIDLQTDADRAIAHLSFPALYKISDLKQLLKSISSEKSIDQFLDILSWDTSNKDAFLDLQYQPFVKIDDYYLLQSLILASSNIPRSIFLSENKRGNNFKAREFSKHRSLAKIMTEAFSGQGFICKAETEVKFDSGDKKHGDIDFLAFKDGVLFIAECKDSTYPTDFFELRTTYDHVIKAASQIKHILAALNDAQYLKVFGQQTGIQIERITHIVPTIVLSNRKFWGYSIDGFAVRSIKEIVAFIVKGKWSYKLPDGDLYDFKLWKEDEFQAEDIIDFCGKNCPHEKVKRAMSKYEVTLAPNIVQNRYSLNLIEAIDILKKSYSYETIASDQV